MAVVFHNIVEAVKMNLIANKYRKNPHENTYNSIEHWLSNKKSNALWFQSTYDWASIVRMESTRNNVRFYSLNNTRCWLQFPMKNPEQNRKKERTWTWTSAVAYNKLKSKWLMTRPQEKIIRYSIQKICGYREIQLNSLIWNYVQTKQTILCSFVLPTHKYKMTNLNR